MKVSTQLLAVFAIGALAQKQSPVPTAQPPLHSFPPVDTVSGGSLPTELGTRVTQTTSGGSTQSTGSGSVSGSGTAATTGATSTSTGLAAPTAGINIAPILGIAAAVLVL